MSTEKPVLVVICIGTERPPVSFILIFTLSEKFVHLYMSIETQEMLAQT